MWTSTSPKLYGGILDMMEGDGCASENPFACFFFFFYGKNHENLTDGKRKNSIHNRSKMSIS